VLVLVGTWAPLNALLVQRLFSMPPFSFACQAYTNHTQRTSRRPITVTATEPRNQTPSAIYRHYSTDPHPPFRSWGSHGFSPCHHTTQPSCPVPVEFAAWAICQIPRPLFVPPTPVRLHLHLVQCCACSYRSAFCHAMPCRNQRARRPRKKKTGAVDVIVLTAQSIIIVVLVLVSIAFVYLLLCLGWHHWHYWVACYLTG
jgi:hypothetical protein